MRYEGNKFYLAVDNIIFGFKDDALHLLLFKREVTPGAGEWSLIGAFVNIQENVDDAAERVLFELTGLKNLFMEQLHCFGDADRDPGGRVISVAYWSLIKVNINELELNIENHIAKWFKLDEVPSLIFDHSEMVSMAITKLRERARFYPVGFELLPKEFTMPQLLKVYEAIFDSKIDDRNFRKKILKSGLLLNLNKKDKTTSKKGSFLYQFDEDRYKTLQDKGYNFDFSF